MAYRATQYQPVDAAVFEQRAAQRHPVTIATASIRRLGKKPVDAVLKDVSIYGCRIESKTRHVRGDKVWVKLDEHVPVSGLVVWATDGMIGCRFDAPLDRTVVRSIVLAMA
jgi:hypothetical protein